MTQTNGLAAASAVPDHLAQAALAPAADFEPDGIPVDECDGEDHDDPDDDGALYCNTGALACLFDELTEPDCDPAKRLAAVAALRVPAYVKPVRTPADELVAGRKYSAFHAAAIRVPDGMVRVGDAQLGTRIADADDPRGYVEVIAVDDQPTYGRRELWYDGKAGTTGLVEVDTLLPLHTEAEGPA